MSKLFRENLRAGFDKYVSAFDAADERISGKICHTYQVAKNCIYIAEKLGLPEHDTDLAYALGMLHDVGRFEQARRFRTFLDSVYDHAQMGADYLFNENGLAEFLAGDTLPDEETELLELAIRQHNRHILPENLDDRELLFCNLIRDADKVDIYRFTALQSFEVCHEYPAKIVSASSPTGKIIEYFNRRETVLFSERETPADIYLSHVALCFGLVYDCSKQLLDEQGYIWRMMDFRFDSPEVQSQFEKMKQSVTGFFRG